MARKRAQNTNGTFKADDKSTPDVNEAWVETKSEVAPAEEPKGEEFVETPETEAVTTDPKAPVNIELTATEEPQTPAPAAAPDKIQTSVRERLAKKSEGENIFTPSSPAALEKAAEQVAQEQGFEYNRGTSIGARLIARAQKRV